MAFLTVMKNTRGVGFSPHWGVYCALGIREKAEGGPVNLKGAVLLYKVQGVPVKTGPLLG